MKALFCFIFIISSIYCVADTLNPDAARTNAKLGLAYLQKGLYPAGKECLLTALREDPAIASPWYSMGYFLEKTNHEKSAQLYYQKAIEVNPESGSAKNNDGIFLCHQHAYLQAITEFVLAADEPSYLHAEKAYKNAGECALRIPDKKLAEWYFRKAKYD